MRVLQVTDSLHDGQTKTFLLETASGPQSQGTKTHIIIILPDSNSFDQPATAVRLGRCARLPDLTCGGDVLFFPSGWEGLGCTTRVVHPVRPGSVASEMPPMASAIGGIGWPLGRQDDGRALASKLTSVVKPCTVKEVREAAKQGVFRAEAATDRVAHHYCGTLRDTGHHP